jgi:hypothetical protein
MLLTAREEIGELKNGEKKNEGLFWIVLGKKINGTFFFFFFVWYWVKKLFGKFGPFKQSIIYGIYVRMCIIFLVALHLFMVLREFANWVGFANCV